MRVLHLYSGNLFGGIERMLVALHGNRRAPTDDQRFALCFEGRLHRELVDAGADVELLGAARVSRPWTLWRARRRLAASIRARRPDVVVAHAWWACGLFGPVVRAAGLPLVLAVHDVPAEGRGNWLERWAKRSRPDAVVANSRFTLEGVRRLFPTTPADVCYPPVPAAPASDRAAVREEMNVGERDVVIVISARFEPWKGHAALIDALGLLRDQPTWRCWVAGGVQRPHEAAYLDQLRAAASRYGIEDRVRFMGACDNVPRLLSGADIHCQPNTAPEPFGIALVEAMQAGLAIATSNVGGGAEVVGDSCGLLVQPENVQELAVALRRLINDADLREALGQRARERAGQVFGAAAALQRWQVVLSELTGAPAAEIPARQEIVSA